MNQFIKKYALPGLLCETALLLCAIAFIYKSNYSYLLTGDAKSVLSDDSESSDSNKKDKDFIKWVDFNLSYDALETAYKLDVESVNDKVHLDWITLLAYAAAKNGGNCKGKFMSYLNEIADELKSGKEIKDITSDMKYYDYYYKVYSATLGGFIGDYECSDDLGKMNKTYGLKAFSPIAKGFECCEFDDFGTSRSYGFQRRHLGHDMMGLTGTPIIAVESGYVEILGWNQYGGWRIGIRSFDKKRYYYYAHLRQNRPYTKNLKEGDIVTAGDVIGYMGRTGYSSKENVNNIETTHLHFGIELIFDESQKECDNEIWINCYSICRFLSKHKSEVTRNDETKEWIRSSKFSDPTVKEYKNKLK